MCLTSAGRVLGEGTLVPRQGLLEGLGEVEEAPADDDVIVESHEETHLRAREASYFRTLTDAKTVRRSYTGDSFPILE